MYIAYTAIYVYNHSYTDNLSRDWPHLLNLDFLHQHHQPDIQNQGHFFNLPTPATKVGTKTNAQKKLIFPPIISRILLIFSLFSLPICYPLVPLTELVVWVQTYLDI